jgi:hypothetical protein
MRIRENLSGIVASTSRNIVIPPFKQQIGKVFGVITTENTPTEDLFKNNGGFNGIGTIFYLDYDQSKDTTDVDLSACKVAKPFYASSQDYPLVGELVLLTDGPAATSQVTPNASQKYYLGIINIWNNNQHNSPSTDSLGKTFSENADIRNLLAFEGDRIYQGRKGNGIRFGSTVSSKSNVSEWSSVGKNGDPITILVNGYITTDKKSLSPNIEEINKELSSIYMTSTQKIPLIPDRSNTLNPITLPKLPNVYENGSQLIFNSDRITLNSKKDEVMIFAKTNIEINTNNIINLNAGNYTHVNSPKISLGTKKDGTVADEPLLLGNKTKDLLTQLMSIIEELSNGLASAVAPPQGSPLIGVNIAGASAVGKLEALQKQLKNITSTNNFTT